MRLLLSLFLCVPLLADILVHTRPDGIQYSGSSTVFVGHYTWPTDRRPLMNYVTSVGDAYGNYPASAGPDFDGVTCDLVGSYCTLSFRTGVKRGTEAYSLPTDTEVVFVTKANTSGKYWSNDANGTPPGGLVDWDSDKNKRYYIRDFGTNGTNTFKLAETPGGAAITLNAGVAQVGTLGMSFAGYTHVLSFRFGVGKQFTCDPATDICTTTTPHKLVENRSVWVQSSGTLPAGQPAAGNTITLPEGGLVTYQGGQWKSYCIGLGGVPDPTTQFKFYYVWHMDTSCGSTDEPMDITSAGTGTHLLYNPLSVGDYPNAYIRGVTGYPTGTVFHWLAGADPAVIRPVGSNGTEYPDNAAGGIAIVAKVPAVTAPGTASVSINLSESSTSDVNPNGATLAYTVNLVSIVPANTSGPPVAAYAANPIPGKTAATVPAGIPSVRNWEYIMTAADNGGGSHQYSAGYWRCINRSSSEAPFGYLSCLKSRVVSPYIGGSCSGSTPTTDSTDGSGNPYWYQTLSFPGVSQQVWFYANTTYGQIANYRKAKGDADWKDWQNCQAAIGRVFQQYYIFNPNTFNAGYYQFPWALAATHGITGEASMRLQMLRQTADKSNVGFTDSYRMRDTAFAIEKFLAKETATGQPDYAAINQVDEVLGFLWQHGTTATDRGALVTFHAGLGLKAVIEWYQRTHDERVPQVVKAFLDKFWASYYCDNDAACWDGSGGGTPGAPHDYMYEVEPFGLRCRPLNANVNPGWCQASSSVGMNNLISPAFAWYWRLTGDDTYKTRGDRLFAYAWFNEFPYWAKTYSEGFYWSWDYVRWREGTQPAY